ncbi:hypothetical protein C4D60_Mb07t02090 [Musa balbisiana]|uniref:GBF-interacting protein 1 N-terminal domain-containing protein n=1 Tax=Musa balbisiana TaxID=52838 RepID=A0A4S8JEU7_MUSBA|nr:hypothetical protein C4D60_Mb07t02090 [Musa balbisiana]
MSGAGGGGNRGSVAAPIPTGSRKLVQSLKEIVNCPEAEIYAMLRECNMDPNEAVHRLLSQDTFHEVKSKRDKKKEIREPSESRSRNVNNSSGRGARGGLDRGGRSTSSQSSSTDYGAGKSKSLHKKENGASAVPNASVVECFRAMQIREPSESRSRNVNNSSGRGARGGLDRGGRSTSSQSSSTDYGAGKSKSLHKKENGASAVPNSSVVESSVLSSSPTQRPTTLRNHEYDNDGQLEPTLTENVVSRSGSGSENLDVPLASQPEVVRNDPLDTAHVLQYNFPSASDYALSSAAQPNAAAFSFPQGNTQVQTLSPFSSLMQPNTLQNSILASSIPHLRDFDLPLSPLLTTQAMPTRYSTTVSSISGPTISTPEALNPGVFSNPQLPSTTMLTSPALPQHLPVHHYSQPALPLGHFANMISYPFLPQSYTYLPSIQQAFAANSPFHQSPAAVPSVGMKYSQPQFKSSLSATSLPQASAIASAYGGLGNSANIPGAFILNHATASASTTIGFDEALSLQYKEGSHYMPLQQSENPAMWIHGVGSRTMSALPASTFYNYPGQNQHSGIRLSQQTSQLGALGYPNLYHSQAGPTRYSTTVSSISGPTISTPEALNPGVFSNPQLPSTTMLTSPALPQHLPVHHYSQPALPLGHFANMISYPFLPQSYTYLPSIQQAFAANSPFHQSPAAVPSVGMKYSQPQFKSSLSATSLPQASAIASAYGGLGNSANIPGAFILNHATASASTTIGFDEALSLQYKEGSHYMPLQQSENPAMWIHGVGSRTMSALPASTFYNYPGQNQHSGIRLSQQTSQLGALGYPNLYHSQAGPSREHQQNPAEGNLNGSQTPSQPANQIWQHGY